MTTGTLYSKLAGVKANNPDGTSRQELIRKLCHPGMRLILEREPDNPHDSNAIAVMVWGRVSLFRKAAVQIGYLNADIADELAKYLDNGGEVECEVKEVTGGEQGRPNLGVNIRLRKS